MSLGRLVWSSDAGWRKSEGRMSRKGVAVGLGFWTALNLIALVAINSTASNAAIAGRNAAALARDPDFTKAVMAVVQTCKVNIDLASIECPTAGAK
jgi:hypothetical protein